MNPSTKTKYAGGNIPNLPLLKLFFILMLGFLNSLCFASDKEEETRLQEITAILVEHLNVDWSPTKLMHGAMIDYAAENKMAFDEKEAEEARPFVEAQVAKHVDVSKCFSGNIITKYIEASNKNPKDREVLAKVFVQPLVTTLRRSKDDRFIYCHQIAFYTFNSIIFDNMNKQAAGEKPLFTSIAFLSTTRETGDHLAVIVGGASGVVYLIDPWAKKFSVIKEFSKKSGWKNELQKSSLDLRLPPLHLKENLNTPINALYKEKGYYDMLFVKPNTQWMLYMAVSNHMRQLIQTPNNEQIELLYRSLAPMFGWKIAYSNLFDEAVEIDKESAEKSKT